MSLWTNVDEQAGAPVYKVVNAHNVSVSGTDAFNDSGVDDLVPGVAVGVFGVSEVEQLVDANPKGGHAGWVLRTEGTGGRAGRVHIETLVAMSSISGDSENTIFPDS